MRKRKTHLWLLGLCLLAGGRVLAGEGMWGENGRVISNAVTNPSRPQLIHLDSGGALICWGTSDGISAQRINSQGIAQWPANGVVICNAISTQSSPQLVSDGSGGAIIVWEDARNYAATNYDVYAQRIDSSGVVQWTANGVCICNAGNNQGIPQLVSDNSNGAIIVWADERVGDNDIYAQRVDTNGNTKWADNGVVISNAAASQWSQQLIPDDSGGALIVWSGGGIFVQRIDGNGNTQWTANGVDICSSGIFPQLITLGSGDALVVWQDYRNGQYDIYAQRIDGDGNTQWTANGVVICNAEDDQKAPQLTADGTGGALIAWESEQASGYYDIYARRVDSAGNAQWTANGVVICNAGNNQQSPELTSDGAGGAVIVWPDYRFSEYDIYAQRIDGSGNIQWTANGAVICDEQENQRSSQLIFDGNGEIIIWQDGREGTWSIYAQKIIRPKPQITNLSPQQSPWGKMSTIAVQGRFFQDDRGFVTYAKLTRTGEADIEAINPDVINADTFICNFDLSALTTAGDWYVIVYDSAGQTGTSDTVLFNVHPPAMQSLAWVSSQTANIYTGIQDNLVGQINCTADGYDFLESLSVENVGSARAGTDITVLSLWYLSNGGGGGITFDPRQARKLGEFTAISGGQAWHITLNEEVIDRSALYLTADIRGSAQVGNTCRFSLPVKGADFRFKGALPDFTLLNTIEQVIAKSANLRLEVVSLASANVTQGQCGVRLGRIEATNISGGTISLASILLTLRDPAGNEQDLDTVFTRIWLERAGITVSSLAAPGGGKTFTFTSPLDLFAQDQTTFELKGDIQLSPRLKSFVAGLPHEQCINHSGLLSETIPGQAFPLLTNPVNIREPELTKVFGNYPNPFQPGQGVTRIAYYLKSPGRVKIEVLTMGGQGVKVVVAEEKAAGMQEAEWNGKNTRGYEVRSGIYLLRIEVRYANGTREQLARKVAVAR